MNVMLPSVLAEFMNYNVIGAFPCFFFFFFEVYTSMEP